LLKNKKKSSQPLVNRLTLRCQKSIDFLLPSLPGLHSHGDSSKASFPRLSRSCHVPSSAAIVAHIIVVDFPQGTRRALFTDAQITQLISSAVDNLVAACRAPAAMGPP